MRSVLEACQPKQELLLGTFNPEVFTASLGPVIDFYRTGRSGLDTIYTNGELFFREGTYPTHGMRATLTEVFARIAGDLSVPAIHRLETAFGGGKTHTLIACTHIAFMGSDLRHSVSGVIDQKLLPDPNTVAVVGVAGDDIPVHQPKRNALVPYTLWGEIAYQIGGETLYREVEAEAVSAAAPGKVYFEKVLGGRKVLIMLDELAQYAARLEAARPDGASQLAAFLMGLHGYARNHAGIAIVLTLASSSDAFARQTENLAKLISQVQGKKVSEDEAINIGDQALKGLTSVVARDAVLVTPVQAGEISSVLAKRLFIAIDKGIANDTADEYMAMYRRNANLLPDEASSENFRDRMVATYPFHPTLVDFLNNKLADSETFQGTRGVLRVLSYAVRSIWQNRIQASMIQSCHIDLHSERVVNEILGRTGSGDLLLVLNADVGGVDTGSIEGGVSNAQLADKRNPHPAGIPLYEYTWKSVFLHSLVGRAQGLESKIFGLTEADALFAVAFPGLTPPQVRTALEEINESAFYLKADQGKYYASTDPTINSVLARIRKTLKIDQVQELLETTARKIITGGSGLFHIEHDVITAEDIPDGKKRPILAVVSPNAQTINIDDFITTKGPNRPRMEQNMVFVLVPDTVVVEVNGETDSLFSTQNDNAQKMRQMVESTARQVKAMRILAEKPTSFGVNPVKLEEGDFPNRFAEREQALLTNMASIYTRLYYASSAGEIARREIKTAGGEGGLPFIEQIKELLLKEGKLLTSRNTTMADIVNLSKLFFGYGDTISLEKLRDNFSIIRSWPVLESATVLEQVVRAGVEKGVWCLYLMGAAEATKPSEFYHRDEPVPMGVNIETKGYSLVTLAGANQRGWTKTDKVDTAKVRECVTYATAEKGVATLSQVQEKCTEQYGTLGQQDMDEAVVSLVKSGRLIAYRGQPNQQEKPMLIQGAAAAIYIPQLDDCLITPAKASELGWLTTGSRTFTLSGPAGTQKVLPLLKRIGSLYSRGAQCTIDSLDIVDLELPNGGTLRIQLANASPKSMKELGELFEVLDGVTNSSTSTEVYLDISEPVEECLLMQELKK